MAEIRLTQGKVAIVDDRDYKILSQYKWQAYKRGNGSFYVARVFSRGSTHRRMMYRDILGLDENSVERVKFLDKNHLNCTRSNLKFCELKSTKSKKELPKCIYLSYRLSGLPMYRVRVVSRGKAISFGSFKTLKQAKAALKKAFKKLGRRATSYNQTNLSNKKFGKLHVIDCTGMARGDGYIRWNCQCDCGIKTTANAYELMNKKKRSCGCIRKTGKPGVAASRSLYRGYITAAESRGHAFRISYKRFLFLTSQKCCYCDKEPYNIRTIAGCNGEYKYNGIDRVNNDKGYIEGNCVTCCEKCNRMKWALPLGDFIQQIKDIYSNLSKKDFAINENN